MHDIRPARKEITLMATVAQIAANRLNASHSTGPRTGDGKARSSKNTTTHGFCSKEFLILPGQEQEFDEFLSALLADLVPEDALELDLFRQLAHASWNLHRCRRAEAQLLETSADPAADPLFDDKNEAKLRRLDLYARRSQSAYYKALRELRTL
jgi:hypothetical protein